MNYTTKAFIKCLIAVLLLAVSACDDAPQEANLKAGGYYSVVNDDSTFAVVKILALDSVGVHIRLYGNRFSERPENIDIDELKIGSFRDKGTFGIGHMPLLKRNFSVMMPRYITERPVTGEELEGYRMWKEVGGGYWE